MQYIQAWGHSCQAGITFVQVKPEETTVRGRCLGCNVYLHHKQALRHQPMERGH